MLLFNICTFCLLPRVELELQKLLVEDETESEEIIWSATWKNKRDPVTTYRQWHSHPQDKKTYKSPRALSHWIAVVEIKLPGSL